MAFSAIVLEAGTPLSAGWRFVSVTMMVVASTSDRVPSEAVNVTVYGLEAAASNPGFHAKVLDVNVAPSGSPDAVMVGVVPSGSVADIANCRVAFSAIVLEAGTPLSAGGLFAGDAALTVMATSSVAVPPRPSRTVNVTVCWPTWPAAGIHANAPVVGLIAAPVSGDIEYVSGSLSGSVADTVKLSDTPTVADLAPIAVSTGGLFVWDAGLTVMATCLVPVPP